MTIFGIFDELLSTQNVNLHRFARNIECDFLSGFHKIMGHPVIQEATEKLLLLIPSWLLWFLMFSKSSVIRVTSTAKQKDGW